jgi:acetylornithine deacetylase
MAMQAQPLLNSATLRQDAVQLLQRLICIPSFSREEQGTAACISQWLISRGIEVKRHKNNVWAYNKFFDKNKPTLLLNSHHDTVKPASGYTKDPFVSLVENNKLYGLGSNDAGGALVTLIATFLYYYEQQGLPYNIVLAATAEEEISGKDGVESILPMIGDIDCAIVGEPTLMNMAIAERGLMVLDCESRGIAGHAARNEGDNAIYKALKDIEWIKGYQFEKVSDLLGPVKMTVTVIETENKAHNVVPSSCRFVVDVRVNELYSFEDIIKVLSGHLHSTVTPRSMRLRSSIIDLQHPLVQAGLALNRKYYGSPTTSDKALMSFPALKIGPGDSARSHTADEFIYVYEVEEGLDIYIQLLDKFFASVKA